MSWNNIFDSFLFKALITLLAVLAPVQAVMFAVGFLIVADLATGMIAARKRGEALTSAALRRTVTKMLVYQLAIISGFALEQYILSGALPIIKIVAGFIGLTELKSILENSNTILGLDLFKALIKKLGSQNDKL